MPTFATHTPKFPPLEISALWKPYLPLPQKAVDYIQERHPEITEEQIAEIYRVTYPFALQSAIDQAEVIIYGDLVCPQGKVELSTRLLSRWISWGLPMVPRRVRHHLQELNKLQERLFGVTGGDR